MSNRPTVDSIAESYLKVWFSFANTETSRLVLCPRYITITIHPWEAFLLKHINLALLYADDLALIATVDGDMCVFISADYGIFLTQIETNKNIKCCFQFLQFDKHFRIGLLEKLSDLPSWWSGIFWTAAVSIRGFLLQLGVFPALGEVFPRLQQEHWKAGALQGKSWNTKWTKFVGKTKKKYQIKKRRCFFLDVAMPCHDKRIKSERWTKFTTPVFVESSRHAWNQIEWLYVTVWGTMASAHACYSNHLHCAHPNLKSTHPQSLMMLITVDSGGEDDGWWLFGFCMAT